MLGIGVGNQSTKDHAEELIMTPDEIAEVILNTMMPEARKTWRYEVGQATNLAQITFWPMSLVTVLDIGAVMGCFQDALRQVSWQRDVGDKADSPRVVIQGGLKGTLVQAAFVLRDADH
jgi:hypothetical protein